MRQAGSKDRARRGGHDNHGAVRLSDQVEAREQRRDGGEQRGVRTWSASLSMASSASSSFTRPFSSLPEGSAATDEEDDAFEDEVELAKALSASEAAMTSAASPES